jgi:hypothetical protein
MCQQPNGSAVAVKTVWSSREHRPPTEGTAMDTKLFHRIAATALVAGALTAAGAVTAIGSSAANAVTVSEKPGAVTLLLEANEVPRAATNVPFAEGICTNDMYFPASSDCTASLQECAKGQQHNRSPLLMAVDPVDGDLISCVATTSQGQPPPV